MLAASVTDEAAWMQWDTDQDGSLSGDEYRRVEPMLGVAFAIVDKDSDARATPPELAAAIEDRQFATRDLLVLQVGVDTAPVWTLLDENRDEQLSERELTSAVDKVRAARGEQAAWVRGTLPRRLHFEVRRSAANDLRGQPVPIRVNVAGQKNDAAPAWFVQLDRNGDSEVSWREFLGSRDQFDALDHNQDGFLESSEAPR